MNTEPTTNDPPDSVAVQRLVLPALGLAPAHPITTPHILVTPSEHPEQPAMPFDYFINPIIRHCERLSGMSGDTNQNRFKE
jgi:hypothetical protein